MILLDHFLIQSSKIEKMIPIKSVVTWNDYLGRVKYFMRWLYNCKTKGSKESDLLADPVYWETPSFVQIRKKKTKRLSPYSETEIGIARKFFV
jgi:hypothetical protein